MIRSLMGFCHLYGIFFSPLLWISYEFFRTFLLKSNRNWTNPVKKPETWLEGGGGGLIAGGLKHGTPEHKAELPQYLKLMSKKSRLSASCDFPISPHDLMFICLMSFYGNVFFTQQSLVFNVH